MTACLLLLLLACAPRWWQSTTWEGDETMATGVVCQGDILRPDTEFFVRVAVRYHEDVEVDWQAAELGLVNAEVVSRDLGPVRVAAPRTFMRYDTWYVKPAPGEESGPRVPDSPDRPRAEQREVAALGPYEVPWRPPGREDWVSWQGEGCTARLVGSM